MLRWVTMLCFGNSSHVVHSLCKVTEKPTCQVSPHPTVPCLLPQEIIQFLQETWRCIFSARVILLSTYHENNWVKCNQMTDLSRCILVIRGSFLVPSKNRNNIYNEVYFFLLKSATPLRLLLLLIGVKIQLLSVLELKNWFGFQQLLLLKVQWNILIIMQIYTFCLSPLIAELGCIWDCCWEVVNRTHFSIFTIRQIWVFIPSYPMGSIDYNLFIHKIPPYFNPILNRKGGL